MFLLCSYPFVYSVVVLPVSIVRWATFTHHTVPDAATFFTVFLHDSFGAVNVILLLTTRQGLLLFKDPREAQGHHRASDMGRAPEMSPSRAPSIRSVEEILSADARTDAALELLDAASIGQNTGHPHHSPYAGHVHIYELSSRSRGSGRGEAGNVDAFASAPSLLGSRN